MKTATRKKLVRKKKTPSKVAASYEAIKQHEGKQYVGMQIGRSHKWYYDKGEWKDKKITPDLWEIRYAVAKRRAGKAPKGSGAPVGTGYHWYIMAHQEVLKLNADDYSTVLSGLKYKLAHKRAAKGNWSASAAAQRKRLIKFLKEMVAQLEKEPIPLKFTYNDVEYKGEAIPVPGTCTEGVCYDLDINLNGRHVGMLHRLKNSWKIEGLEDEKLANTIGEIVLLGMNNKIVFHFFVWTFFYTLRKFLLNAFNQSFRLKHFFKKYLVTVKSSVSLLIKANPTIQFKIRFSLSTTYPDRHIC